MSVDFHKLFFRLLLLLLLLLLFVSITGGVAVSYCPGHILVIITFGGDWLFCLKVIFHEHEGHSDMQLLFS